MKNKEFIISAGTDDMQWIFDLAKLIREKGVEPVGKAMGRYLRLVSNSTPDALRYLEATFNNLEKTLGDAVKSSNNPFLKQSAAYVKNQLPELFRVSKGALLDAGQILKNAPNAGKAVLKGTLEGFGYLLQFFKFFGDGPPNAMRDKNQENKTVTAINNIKKPMGMSM